MTKEELQKEMNRLCEDVESKEPGYISEWLEKEKQRLLALSGDN